jgi:hypothetical protein
MRFVNPRMRASLAQSLLAVQPVRSEDQSRSRGPKSRPGPTAKGLEVDDLAASNSGDVSESLCTRGPLPLSSI